MCARAREISQMAWQGAGQIKHRLLGLDRLAGIATVAGPYVYASLSSSWASALACRGQGTDADRHDLGLPRQRRFRVVNDFTSRLRGNAPPGICGDGQHHARFGGGGCGPERCDKGSRCATPAIPAGRAMTQVMTTRLSQLGIAGLLPAPSPGNRHLPSEAGR